MKSWRSRCIWFFLPLLIACGKSVESSPSILLFNGEGVDVPDWMTLETLLRRNGYTYELVDSPKLNSMSVDDIAKFRMILVPGGYGDTIAENLKREARLRIRDAVRRRGLGYLGICAGAWVAVGNEATTDEDAEYGFAVAEGDSLELYRPNGRNPLADIVRLKFPAGRTRDVVWWGGPSTPEWRHGVVARYPTGEPAISQTRAGAGFVVVTGPHPEAAEDWWEDSGPDPDGLDHDLALQLIDAALMKEPLPSFD